LTQLDIRKEILKGGFSVQFKFSANMFYETACIKIDNAEKFTDLAGQVNQHTPSS